MYSWRSYGFPFRFLRIHQEGCFDERAIRTEFSLINLLLDVVIFLSVVTCTAWAIKRRKAMKVKIEHQESKQSERGIED